MFDRCIFEKGGSGEWLIDANYKTGARKVVTIFLGFLVAVAVIAAPAGSKASFQAGKSPNFSAAGQAESYLLSVDYNKDNYTVQGITLIKAQAPDQNSQVEKGFRCEIVSVNDEILYSLNFGAPNIQCSDTFGKEASGGCTAKESGEFSLQLPYFKTAKLISIYDQNDKMVLAADVSSFAQLCGDNICQENENALTCPQDCKSGIKDGICDRQIDGVCDPDCAKGADPDCAATANYYYYVAAIAVLILLAGLAGYLIWRKNNKNGERAEGDDEEQN